MGQRLLPAGGRHTLSSELETGQKPDTMSGLVKRITRALGVSWTISLTPSKARKMRQGPSCWRDNGAPQHGVGDLVLDWACNRARHEGDYDESCFPYSPPVCDVSSRLYAPLHGDPAPGGRTGAGTRHGSRQPRDVDPA